MKRTHFRNLWLLTLLVLVGSTWLMFRKAEEIKTEFSRAEKTLTSLKHEKRNAEKLAASLKELDNLTVDERATTRLDILRHLGMQKQEYDFKVSSRQAEKVGTSKLYVRLFELAANLRYAKALQLADDLHANKKVVLHKYEMSPVASIKGKYGDWVSIKIKGSLYGLEKKDKK